MGGHAGEGLLRPPAPELVESRVHVGAATGGGKLPSLLVEFQIAVGVLRRSQAKPLSTSRTLRANDPGDRSNLADQIDSRADRILHDDRVEILRIEIGVAEAGRSVEVELAAGNPLRYPVPGGDADTGATLRERGSNEIKEADSAHLEICLRSLYRPPVVSLNRQARAA